MLSEVKNTGTRVKQDPRWRLGFTFVKEAFGLGQGNTEHMISCAQTTAHIQTIMLCLSAVSLLLKISLNYSVCSFPEKADCIIAH